MNKQSEALRLADILESWKGAVSNDAAAELRRLHEVNAELVEALGEIEWSNNSKWQQDRARTAILKATGEQQ